MNYKEHYNLLCERAKTRTLDCYVEIHHVIPRCLGGSNNKDNLIKLTPEEHYVAHQLLVKMYPQHKGLVWAALKMTRHPNNKRCNNKLYGWLKRKNQQITKQRKGFKNGSYGRYWYHHPVSLLNVKCFPEEVPLGYVKGRKFKHNNMCKVCGKDTKTVYRIYCETHKPGRPLLRQCKNCYSEFDRKTAETGRYSPYCSVKCRERNINEKTSTLEKEARIWYNKYINGNYVSLRDFCRKNDINAMTVSKRFRRYIGEYKGNRKL